MSYDKIKQFCCKCWEEDFNCLHIERSKIKKERRYFFIENEIPIFNLRLKNSILGFPDILMCYSNKKREDLKQLTELVLLQNQVKSSRLQNILGKQKFIEDIKKVFEPVIKSIKDASRDITKTMTETSKECC